LADLGKIGQLEGPLAVYDHFQLIVEVLSCNSLLFFFLNLYWNFLNCGEQIVSQLLILRKTRAIAILLGWGYRFLYFLSEFRRAESNWLYLFRA
jgi:hypothetical protein